MLDEPRDALFLLQRWYLAQCDGDWEHSYGVRIDTIDNPGWSLRVDLSETALETAAADWSKLERSEHDWLHWRLLDGRYEAFAGPTNLNEAILTFLDFVAGRSHAEVGAGTRSLLRWHAGLEGDRDDAGSISGCTASGTPAGEAVAAFIQALQRLNIELNGATPSENVDSRDDPLPRDVAYAVAEAARMLRDTGDDDAASQVDIGWSAVLAGDIDDVVEHIAQERRGRDGDARPSG
jgi:hypothetical protein